MIYQPEPNSKWKPLRIIPAYSRVAAGARAVPKYYIAHELSEVHTETGEIRTRVIKGPDLTLNDSRERVALFELAATIQGFLQTDAFEKDGIYTGVQLGDTTNPPRA